MNSLLAYQGDYELFGTANDPMIGQRIGGTITFGGALALYSGKSVVGGLGLSGDTAGAGGRGKPRRFQLAIVTTC